MIRYTCYLFVPSEYQTELTGILAPPQLSSTSLIRRQPSLFCRSTMAKHPLRACGPARWGPLLGGSPGPPCPTGVSLVAKRNTQSRRPLSSVAINCRKDCWSRQATAATRLPALATPAAWRTTSCKRRGLKTGVRWATQHDTGLGWRKQET